MDPIASANKYVQEAMEEYGVFDYSAIPDEDEEFGFLDQIVSAVTTHGPKLLEQVQKNPAIAKGIMDAGANLLGQSKKTTAKGRKNISSSRKKMSASKAAGQKPSGGALVQNFKGQIQVALGEMRRQITMSGIVDPDVQLEIIRNAFAKQYRDQKNDPKVMTLQKNILKKSIHEMDQKLMQAFTKRNADRIAKGLPPLQPGIGEPTLEYKV